MNQASQHDLQLGKWLGGAALGALVMYMLDPDRGAPRRAQSGEKLRQLGRQTGDALEKVVQGMGQSEGSSADGKARSLVNAARDTLAHPGQPWTSGTRGAAMLGGGTLGLAGMLTRRMPMTLMLGLAGAALLTRGATNRSLRGMMGMSAAQAGSDRVDVEKTVQIDAAPEQVYDLWANYENFPRFMANVVEIRDLGERRSHWVVKGPAGSEFEFDAILTDESRPRRLAWKSAPGSEVEQWGSVEFTPSRGGTLARVHMSYRPPAGKVGQAVASMFGGDPATELQDDLGRMKNLVEGKPGAPLPTQGAADSKVLH